MNQSTENPSVLDLVLQGLKNGVLWIVKAEPVWTGDGTLKPCVVCQQKINTYEKQHDVPGPRGALPAHVKCYKVWRVQSDKLRMENSR